MTVWMADSTISRLYAEGNVQTIMFPMENDSTYNKFSYTESSYMDAYFEDNTLRRLIMWPETTGKVTPLYLAKRNSYYLPKFRWYEPLRPMSPAEVFEYPAEMAELARQNILGRMSKTALTARGQATGKPAPQVPVAKPDIPAPPADSAAVTADSLTVTGDSIHMTLPDSVAVAADSLTLRTDSITAHPETVVPDSDGNVTPDGSDSPDPSGDPDSDPAAATPTSSSTTVTKQEEEDNDE